MTGNRAVALALALVLALAGAPALAESRAETLRGWLTENDAKMLVALDDNAAAKIAEGKAKFTVDGAAIAEIETLLGAPRAPIGPPADIEGEWRIRSLQITNFGAYAYPFFKVRIYAEGPPGALVFHKDTGSQRIFAELAADGSNRYILVGAGYAGGDPPGEYSTRAYEQPGDPYNDIAGHLYRLADGRLLLVTAPNHLGLNVLELKRQ